MIRSIRFSRPIQIGMLTLFVFLGHHTSEVLGFGKNKVQYKEFDWRFLQSKHFDVYYYDDAKPVAEFTADVAESSYVSLKKNFQYDLEKRIPILIYNGHNDFQQTNVTLSEIGESVGGFTELFKDRVVIPFQGDYEDFRHVIHHELTHAVMFQLYYGGGVGAAVSGMARFQIPLWLAEGLAEYESLGWDTASDMFMRDAALNGYVPPINYMYGYMVYKGGQSLMNYIAEKYGPEKIGEMLGKIRLTRNVENGIKQTLGIDIEELSKRWHKHLRKTYWPDVQNRFDPEDIAKRLTDHTKGEHFLNGAPALSPKGDKLVYLSDKSDYMDIRLISTIDAKDKGRIVKGQRSDLFEQMHWLRPGMSWSPDGKQITFAAKAGEMDRLYIIDVRRRKIVKDFKLGLDGVYSPSWSPDGKKIAFMGLKGIQSDIYVLTLEDEKLSRLTRDIFSDMDPRWSPDGTELVFVSDRKNYLGKAPVGFKMQDHDYSQKDIYILNVESQNISRFTDTPNEEKSPAFSPDGSKLVYISDESGIDNIYVHDRSADSKYAITNLMTGISQISLSKDGSRLAFSAFSGAGYDIYMINNPLETPDEMVVLEKTTFMLEMEEEKSETQKSTESPEVRESQRSDFKNFVFDRNFREGKLSHTELYEKEFPDSNEFKTADGEYKAQKYKVKFTPDMVTGGAGYSQFYGLQGSSMLVLSDILGNHQIQLYTDLFYSLKNSNFMAGYYYLPKKTDIGVSIFHYSLLYYTYFAHEGDLYYGYLRDRNFGARLFLSRPISRYRRFDFMATVLGINRDLEALNLYYPYYGGDFSFNVASVYKKRTVFFSLGHTTDTVLWGMTGPVNGGRSNITVNYSPLISEKNGLSFYSIRADFRKYFRIGKDYTFAARIAGGFSDGKNPQRYLLGGMSNWINYKYRDVIDETLEEDMFFFSSFEGPLRGTRFYEMLGRQFTLANLEFRFPLIQYLILGWPLRLGFQNIRGVAFMDIGSAWNNYKSWKPLKSNPSNGFLQLNDLKSGYGFGARVNMGFLLLRYDIAWQTDFAATLSNPVHYWSIGADF